MNIQIFGTSKCFDTKKAERWFKERRIRFQQIDLSKQPMSAGEFNSVLRAVGGAERLINAAAKGSDADLFRYLADDAARQDYLFEHQKLLQTPVVRNGNRATVGYCPQIWENWQ